jgi:hypothetical protein
MFFMTFSLIYGDSSYRSSGIVINEKLGTKKACIRKLVDLEFEKASLAALQENKNPSAIFTAKSKIVELMEEMGVLEGTLSDSEDIVPNS